MLERSTAVTNIRVNNGVPINLSLSSKPNYEILEIDVTPKNSDEIIYFKTENTNLFIVEKIDNRHVKLTPKEIGTGKLITYTNSSNIKINTNVNVAD